MNTFLDTSSLNMPELVSPTKDIDSLYDVQTNGKKQTFLCKLPDCGKVFRYKSEIIRHIATHSNYRPFVCTHEGCKKGFKRADALENHVRTHTKETPFVCSIVECGMSFPTKASLRYHTLKHKNQKIYQCNFPGCNKAFITVFQLKQHEKSACIHKKLKNTEDSDDLYVPQNGIERPIITASPEKESIISSVRAKPAAEWELKTPVPIQKFDVPQVPFEHKVRNILTENQLLKKRLEVSQQIINLLQHKNEASTVATPYMENPGDFIAENSSFFFRPSLFQGPIYE